MPSFAPKKPAPIPVPPVSHQNQWNSPAHVQPLVMRPWQKQVVPAKAESQDKEAAAKQVEVEAQHAAPKTEPDKLDAVWEKGMTIDYFKALAKKADVTLENLHSVVTLGNTTDTDPYSGQITLIFSKVVDELVVDFTHEMTNRWRRKMLAKAIEAVKTGAIEPYQYAERIVEIEAEGVKNQILVASQLPEYTFEYYFGPRGKAMDSLVMRYRSGAIDDKELLTEIRDQAESAIVADTGESAHQIYAREGRAFRDRYLEIRGNKRK